MLRTASWSALPEQGADVGDPAGDGGGRGGERRRQERAAAAALAALEVAVAGADGVLAGLEAIAVHRDAHRAAGLAPLGTGVEEHAVEPLALGLALDGARAGHDEGADAARDLAAGHDAGCGAEIGEPRVGARPAGHD